jgi:hypothetical protein
VWLGREYRHFDNSKLGRSQIAEAAIRRPHGRRTHRGGVCLSTLYNLVASVCLYQEANSQLRANLISVVDRPFSCTLLLTLIQRWCTLESRAVGVACVRAGELK